MSNYVDTFERSLGRLVSEQMAFFDRFYERFIGSDPEVAEIFDGVDLERQKQVLRESLRELLIFFIDHEISSYMRNLARVHGPQGRNIRVELYDRWLETILATAREIDEQFSDNDELAWRLVLSPGIELMKFEMRKEERR